MYTGQPTLT